MWHFWGQFGQLWSQIGDLKPVKTPGNYDVGACQNKLTCTCFLIKITSAIVEAVNESACPAVLFGVLKTKIRGKIKSQNTNVFLYP